MLVLGMPLNTQNNSILFNNLLLGKKHHKTTYFNNHSSKGKYTRRIHSIQVSLDFGDTGTCGHRGNKGSDDSRQEGEY